MGNISTKFKKALIQGDEATALAIYKSNVDIQKSLEPCTSLGDNYHHNTPLHYAFKNAMPQFVNIFLRDYSIDLRVRNALGQTVLHLLCKHAARSRCPTHEGAAPSLGVGEVGGYPDPPGPDPTKGDTERRVECFEALWMALLLPTDRDCSFQDGRHSRYGLKSGKETKGKADDRLEGRPHNIAASEGNDGPALFDARDSDRGWGALHYASASGNAPLARLLIERAGCRVSDRVTPYIRSAGQNGGGGFIQNGGGRGRGWQEDGDDEQRRKRGGRPVNNALEVASASAILDGAPPCCSELILGYLEFVAIFLSDETEVVSCRELSELEITEPYSTLSRIELQEHKDQLIVETSDMLGVPLFTAEGLLRNYEWSRSKLLEAWIRDPVTCCRKSGVQSPVRENILFSTSPTPPPPPSGSGDENLINLSEELHCGICELTYKACGPSLEEGPLDKESKYASTFRLAQLRKARMDCDHAFCQTCWESYLTLKIQEGNVHVIMCPAFDCHHLVPVEFIERVVSRDMAKKYLQYDIQAFVESNPTIKWCPHPGCTRAVKFPETSLPHLTPSLPTRQSSPPLARQSSAPPAPTSVSVDCGASHHVMQSDHVTNQQLTTVSHHFCWGCGGCAHAPSACSWWNQWGARISRMDPEEIRGNAEESDAAANRLWLITNAKPCPNCGSPIQKNEGCNHMRCCKCKFDFCWICLDPWKKHSSSTGGYFRCHRYEATQKARDRANLRAAEAREKNEKMRELTRFVQHYTKFNDQENRLIAEETTLAEGITNKIAKLRAYFTYHQNELLHCPLLSQVLSPNKLAPYLKLKTNQDLSSADQPSSSKDHVTSLEESEREFLRDLRETSFDPSFLRSALEQLIKARMVCRAAVVYAYYLPPDESCYNKTIFDFMQNELEEYTDNLGRMINIGHLTCPRLKIIQMTHFLARKRQEFLAVLATGLVPPETPPLLRKFRRKYFPNLMDMDLGENDSRRALARLYSTSTLPAVLASTQTPRSYFLTAPAQVKNQLIRRVHRSSCKNYRGGIEKNFTALKPTTTRTRFYNNGIFSFEIDQPATFKVRSGESGESSQDWPTPSHSFFLRRRCIELDAGNPWVKDDSGRHSNLVALYDWPPPEAGGEGESSDSTPSVPPTSDLLTNSSSAVREVGLVMEQFDAISSISHPPTAVNELNAIEAEKDCATKCGRAVCGKKKVRNPRTGAWHNYCSFKCSQLDKIEKHEEGKKTEDREDSSIYNQNMDMLRAIEMSRLQRLKELQEEILLQQQQSASPLPNPDNDSVSQVCPAQRVETNQSREMSHNAEEVGRETKIVGPETSENTSIFGPQGLVCANTVHVAIMIHRQPSKDDICWSDSCKVTPSSPTPTTRCLDPEAFENGRSRSPSPLSAGGRKSADELLRQLTRTKVPVLELYESLREKALAYSKNLNSPQGKSTRTNDKIADFSLDEDHSSIAGSTILPYQLSVDSEIFSTATNSLSPTRPISSFRFNSPTNGSSQTLDFIDADNCPQAGAPTSSLTPSEIPSYVAPNLNSCHRQKIRAAPNPNISRHNFMGRTLKPKAPLDGSIYGILIRNDLSSPRPKGESVT